MYWIPRYREMGRACVRACVIQARNRSRSRPAGKVLLSRVHSLSSTQHLAFALVFFSSSCDPAERQEDQSNRIHDPVDDALHRLPPAASGGCSKANRAHGDSRWIVGNRIRFYQMLLLCMHARIIDRGAAHALQRQSEAKANSIDRPAGAMQTTTVHRRPPGARAASFDRLVYLAHTATPIVVLVAS